MMKKKVLNPVAMIFLAGLISGSNNALADNLILNPGFEASSVNPVSWKITGPVAEMQPQTTIDTKTFFSGKSGLRMESANHNCHGRAVQSIEITGDQTYLVSARFKIVEGAVSMVEMALEELSRKEIISLDEDKKAAMVSNLMVVLCGDKDIEPVINTGTLNH